MTETRRTARTGLIDDVRHLPRTVRDFVVDGARHLFVAPVRAGRPRLAGLSTGTRTVVAVGAIGYVLSVLLVVFGGPLRAGLTLTADSSGANVLSLPRGLLWLIVSLVALSFALLQTGALHAPWWLRVIVLAITVLGLAFIGTAELSVTGGMTASTTVAFAVGAAMVVLQAVRWRRSPQWWEFIVVLALIGVAIVVAYGRSRATAAEFGLDAAPNFTSLLFFLLGQLAIPMTIVSGISAAEVGLSASVWSTGFASTRLSYLVVGGATVALGIVRVRDTFTSAQTDVDGMTGAWSQVVGAAVVVAVLAGVWFGLDRIADRRAAGSSRIDDVVSDVQSVALPVAVALSITTIPVVVTRLMAQVLLAIDRDSGASIWFGDLSDRLGDDATLLVTRVAAGFGLVGAGIVLARRGRRGPAELTAVIGILLLASYATQDGAVLDSLSGWDRALDLLGVLVVLALVVWRIVRRTVTVAFLGVVLLLLMLTVLLTQRDFVSNPLSIVLGMAGVGFILFGYVWNYITGAGAVNEDSPRFPRESRTLLFTALNVFGVTVLAWAALTRSVEFGTDLGPFAALGDLTIGVPLIVAAFIALLTATLRGDHD